MAHFPMLQNIEDKKCVVIGGGAVALRKVRTLLEFGGSVIVVAPSVCLELKELEKIRILERRYQEKDIADAVLVVAATDSKELNAQIVADCKERNIPVNSVTDPKQGTFIFPAYIKKGEMVAAVSAGGQGPVVAQYLKEQVRPIFTDELQMAVTYMGEIRPRVIDDVQDAKQRKSVFQKLFSFCMETGKIPTEEDYRTLLTIQNSK